MAPTAWIEQVASPIGAVLVVTDAEGRVRAAEFADHADRLQPALRRQYGPAGATLAERRSASFAGQALAAYFAGRLTALDEIAVEAVGTPFERAVWTALRRLRPGETVTYGALAARIGRPLAVRAVGRANGANPVSIIVPCHRVVGADGSLTGYGGGIERKRWLLDHERAHSDAAKAGA
ncbi:MAG: methylated-DNA--[protein]-cysteine S-methyltransferase [Rhodospirillaceae bacterium]|nr:methylated-DNA--[protein]-cysteine S-methyltransferase [Rhodospirillaceae bacterium]